MTGTKSGSPSRVKDILILAAGVCAASTSVLFIKASSVPPVLLASYRMLAAAVILFPLFVSSVRRNGIRIDTKLLAKTLPAGIVLSLHFITWIIGSRLTLAANATLIVDMIPVAMPFTLYFLSRERITGRETAATFIALAGVAFLLISDLGLGNMAGNALCFVSMLLYSLYLVLAKRNNDYPAVWIYVVPVYLIGGLVCLGIGSLFDAPFIGYRPEEWLYVAGLTVIPTVFGHTALNYSMGRLRGQVVAITSLGEFVFVAPLAYLLFGEVPSVFFIPASALILIAAVTSLGTFGRRTPRRAE